VVIGQQQIAAAFGQVHHRVVHVERDQAALQGREALAQVHHPVREERERERMRNCELDDVGAGRGMAAHHVAGRLQRADDLERLRMQRLAGGVRRVGYDERSTRSMPAHASSDWIRRENAGCVMWRS
jgi:hypothetical protein